MWLSHSSFGKIPFRRRTRCLRKNATTRLTRASKLTNRKIREASTSLLEMERLIEVRLQLMTEEAQRRHLMNSRASHSAQRKTLMTEILARRVLTDSILATLTTVNAMGNV